MKKQSTAKKPKTDWNRLRTMPDEKIDLSDIPEIDPSAFKRMRIRMPKPKEQVSMRLDGDVLAWFRRQGRGYQTRINAVLRAYIESSIRR